MGEGSPEAQRAKEDWLRLEAVAAEEQGGDTEEDDPALGGEQDDRVEGLRKVADLAVQCFGPDSEDAERARRQYTEALEARRSARPLDSQIRAAERRARVAKTRLESKQHESGDAGRQLLAAQAAAAVAAEGLRRAQEEVKGAEAQVRQLHAAKAAGLDSKSATAEEVGARLGEAMASICKAAGIARDDLDEEGQRKLRQMEEIARSIGHHTHRRDMDHDSDGDDEHGGGGTGPGVAADDAGDPARVGAGEAAATGVDNTGAAVLRVGQAAVVVDTLPTASSPPQRGVGGGGGGARDGRRQSRGEGGGGARSRSPPGGGPCT